MFYVQWYAIENMIRLFPESQAHYYIFIPEDVEGVMLYGGNKFY